MSLTVLITRPQPAADVFADVLRDRMPDAAILTAPLMEIVTVKDALPDLSGYGSLIVTSQNALPVLAENEAACARPCYCVGGATTERAQDIGLAAVECGPTAAALLNHLRTNPPEAPALYLRGDHVSLDLVGALRETGGEADEVVVYRQNAMSLSAEVLTHLESGGPVLVPLFSARSAQLFFDVCPKAATLHVVAISAAVAECVPHGDVKGLSVALYPTADHMVKALLDAADRINRLEPGY